jgi:hypothetical protein
MKESKKEKEKRTRLIIIINLLCGGWVGVKGYFWATAITTSTSIFTPSS